MRPAHGKASDRTIWRIGWRVGCGTPLSQPALFDPGQSDWFIDGYRHRGVRPSGNDCHHGL